MLKSAAQVLDEVLKQDQPPVTALEQALRRAVEGLAAYEADPHARATLSEVLDLLKVPKEPGT